MIEKKDWLIVKEQCESALVNAEINVKRYEADLKMAKEELAKFPEDKTADPMPDAIKDIAKEMTK